MSKALKVIWRAIRAFALFWVDFIVGDSPEIAVGVVFILALAFLLHSHTPAAAIFIPLAVILLLTFSVWRGQTR